MVTQHKIVITGLALLCSTLFMTDVCSAQKSHPAHAAVVQKKDQPLDSIVAVVNDTIITQSELNNAVDTVKKQFAANNVPTPTNDVLEKQVLEQTINRTLQLQIADQSGVHATDADVEKAVTQVADQNKLTTAQLYEQLAKQGTTEKDYHKEIREEIVLQQIEQQEVGSHIVITPQEIDDFMRSAAWKEYNNKEYHLEDILVALPEAPSPADVETAKKRAEDLLAKIHRGTSFRDVAVAESNSSGALQGGDLGWRQLPQIPPAFASELVHMKKNDILGPVQTPNGFHLVRLVEKRNLQKHDDVVKLRKQVEQLVYQRKFEEGLQSWITKVRSSAFINTNPEMA